MSVFLYFNILYCPAKKNIPAISHFTLLLLLLFRVLLRVLIVNQQRWFERCISAVCSDRGTSRLKRLPNKAERAFSHPAVLPSDARIVL